MSQDKLTRSPLETGVKLIMATLMAILLIVAATGRHSDAEPQRFRLIETGTHGADLYEDTETGELWTYSHAGPLSTDKWLKSEIP